MDAREDTPTAAPAPTRRRGPYRKTEARRKEIVAAALEVFSTSGYRAGSLREIGGLIGFEPSSILHHFPSKEALLEAVLEYKEDSDLQARDGRTDFAPAEIPALLLRLAELNEQVPGAISLYAIMSAESATPDHPSGEYFRVRTERTRRDFRTMFQSLADAGLLAPGVDAEYAAISTFAIWDGIQVHWLIEPDAVSVTDTLRAHLRMITRVTDI
ncbi:TetR/AcrR family transcriptional regulator [Cryobacterium sp. SO2]|uniref:TetR/AcrR family transcriptional regulator n=1 Tax=Cryobacterium sp. SO2 TaxID=1897060 RepID=UPI00223DE563|nr:TetR/AcrR family transcriptional regulator [Cryobacterium sp. SO2]WEO77349.1 TetR/AcrR family transcriptional regulator [Cryobacterium sp. SO2]